MAKLNQQAVQFTQNKNRQKASYYTPPFWKTPHVPRLQVSQDSEFQKDIDCLKQAGIEILDAYIELGDLVIWVNHVSIYDTLNHLKKSRSYETLTEMSAIDYIEQKGGFELFYQLLSYQRRDRLRVRAFIAEGEKLQSVTDIFKSADWSEREMYDMFGIVLEGHPNLKRIIMPDDWHDHPLRKTYPLQGDEAAQWYEVDKIFGEEYREIVGPENRDPAWIDRYDTTRFARIGHEVPYGTDITKGESKHPVLYQEENGVLLVKRLKTEDTKQLKERK